MFSGANLVRRAISRLASRDSRNAFHGSADYWERRYQDGGNSGNGSYGALAEFKAEVLNAFIVKNNIDSVIEFGCGDGNQLRLLQCPRYIGIDVSETAIEHCIAQYKSDSRKQFIVANSVGEYPNATMAMSIDVIFHLVEDSVYEKYMRDLFRAAERYVVIYSSKGDPDEAGSWPPHVLHRTFTDWIERSAPEWKLVKYIPNRYPFRRENGKEIGSFADFYFYEKLG